MNLRLYDGLPAGVKVGNRFFKCDFDFRNVLRMLDIMQRTDILPDARDFLCLRCLMKHPPRKSALLFPAVCALLFEKAPAQGEKLTSFEQDAPLIRAAFRQVYGIDLFRAKLTWFEFTDLLHNLPEGCKYEDVIGIRARPMPAPNKYNSKEREWLMKAKQAVALHLTDAEAARKYDADVARIFAGLKSMIPKEVKPNE